MCICRRQCTSEARLSALSAGLSKLPRPILCVPSVTPPTSPSIALCGPRICSFNACLDGESWTLQTLLLSVHCSFQEHNALMIMKARDSPLTSAHNRYKGIVRQQKQCTGPVVRHNADAPVVSNRSMTSMRCHICSVLSHSQKSGVKHAEMRRQTCRNLVSHVTRVVAHCIDVGVSVYGHTKSALPLVCQLLCGIQLK